MDSPEHHKGTVAGDQQRRKILRLVQDFARFEGYSPSYREIGEKAGLAVSTVSYRVGVLERAGFLSREPRQPRTIAEPADPAT